MTEVRILGQDGSGRSMCDVIGRASLRLALCLALCANLGACALTSLDAEARTVGVLKTIEEADSCRKLSEVNVKTVARIMLVRRNETTIAIELERLARNEAARFGGNTIVPLGPVSDTAQRRYGNYLCPVE